MKRFIGPISAVALTVILLAAGWLHFSNPHGQSSAPGVLRVLCPENWLSPEVIERFAADHEVRIQLFTYSRPAELLRQMANSDGSVDVVCSSSFLLRSLIRSHWLKKADFSALPNARAISVDFLHLPFDPQAEYGLPLFWDLYGLFGKSEKTDVDLRQAIRSGKLGLWGSELNLLHLLAVAGVNFEERLEQEDGKGLADDVKTFLKAATQILAPQSDANETSAALGDLDWIQLPLSRVADRIGGEHHFVLPVTGGALELGMLSMGAKSVQPELALKLINALLDPEQGLATHRRINAGLTHVAYENVDAISPWQKPRALRRFPLTRVHFPDINVDALARFENIYDEVVAPRQSRVERQ